MKSLLPLTIACAATVALPAVSSAAAAAEHPTLVDTDTTQCAFCHEELTVGKPLLHAPFEEDCTLCHEFLKDESGTTTRLADAEPPLCLMCHDDLERAVALDLEYPHMPVEDSCLNCHDPHGSSEPNLLASRTNTLCLDCHDTSDTDAMHQIPVSRTDCAICHDPHGAEFEHLLRAGIQHVPFAEGSCLACHRKPRGTKVRLRSEGADLCYACHTDLRDRFSGRHVHQVVREGQCTRCHDPHLSRRNLLLRSPDPGLCFRCHQEVQRVVTASGAHAAVEGGCETCHNAHTAERASLLIEPIPQLCLECHDADDADLTEKHLGADLRSIHCMSCHDPHGSSEPALIATGSLHEPFTDDCTICHEDGANQILEQGSRDLCYMCHTEIEDFVQQAAVPHEAMDIGECIDCHSPHASRQPKLIKARGGRVCTACHDDKEATDPDQVSHGAIEWIGCHSCHLPHGGDSENLLRKTGNGLCTDCHLRDRVRRNDDGSLSLPGGFLLTSSRAERLRYVDLQGSTERNHPIPFHPVSGEIKASGKVQIAEKFVGQQLGCLSCHTPHVGRSPKLFAKEAPDAQELCIECHQK